MSGPVRSATTPSNPADASDPPTSLNPILRGFNPDPTICVVLASGGTPTIFFLSTSTFEYFPGCAIYTSTDLLNWELIGHAPKRRSQIELRTVKPGADSWASTLRYRPDEGRWYLANCLFQRYRPASDVSDALYASQAPRPWRPRKGISIISTPQQRIFPRGFYVFTDNIWDDNAWSDPVYFDDPGFDQDVGAPPRSLD